jgi:LacI family transcriptional regulator
MTVVEESAWATMIDVARLSGTSLKTVSRVVNGEPNVSAATTAKVRAAMDALGYRRNESASLLRRGQSTGSLALVLEDSSGPFFAALVIAVEQVARLNGYLLFTGGAEGDPTRAARLAEAFLDRRVDGLILATSLADSHDVDDAVPESVPAVFVERPGHHSSRDAVLADNAGGVADAVRHLAAAGHRRIAYIGDDPAYYTAGQRRDGFLAAVAEQQLSADAPVLMDGGASLVDASVLRQWTSGRDAVTAVVTGNNRTSRRLLYALRGDPDIDLGYVCFDEWDTADLMHPSVTTVDQNAGRIGRTAAELLLSRIAGADDPPRHVIVPTHLTVRESATRGLGRPAPAALPFPA